MADINWKGASGRTYGYWINPIGANFKNEPGNYIYAAETQLGSWRPVYIGQTSSRSTRLSSHDREACARWNGATHIHAHTTPGSELSRLDEENDLLARWNPVCNG